MSPSVRRWVLTTPLRARRCALWLLAAGLASSGLQAAVPLTLKLWPQGAPEPTGFDLGPEEVQPKRDGKQVRLVNVSVPTLTIYRPERPNGTGVLVAPGGAYSFLAIEHEGTQVCEQLAAAGVTCALLRYRVPMRSEADPSREALQDAQRAMGLLRHRATEWKIKPDQLGFLGFSAGGHLAIKMALHANQRSYPTDPLLDVADATPNFVIPVYPAYLMDPGGAFRLRPDWVVTANAPPICLVHANDDKDLSTSAGSALLYLEYKRRQLPAELHIYSHGGHGFGLKPSTLPSGDWLHHVLQWMGAMGWMKS